MLNQTEQKFRKTHKTLNNHHLAIHYLSKSVGVVLPLIRKYRSMLQKYRLAIKGFIDGLDKMSTGRLCYEILDPIQLSRYLRTIAKDLTDSHSDYTLAFQHTYQYYAEPMVSFFNSPNFLIIQVPIFLRYKFQLLMSLFSTDVVLIPNDTETYLGQCKQHTKIKLRTGYFVVSDSQYIELTEEQLQMCWKLRGVYYCEQAYLMISKEIKSCEAAIYFKMSEEVKIANCDFRYTQNKEYPPKILDTGDQFVLSNLLQPWILMCEKSQKPFAIPYLMYCIINHTELCECSLTAVYKYQINKATLQCSLGDQPSDDFVMYFVHNQAILDILKHSHNIDVSNQLGKQIDMLTEDIPQFNLPELEWYHVTDDNVPYVYNNVSNVVDVELTKFLYDVAQGINDYMYTNIAEWTIAQHQFWTYMKDVEWWQQVQFVAVILGALCWIVAILICCC